MTLLYVCLGFIKDFCISHAAYDPILRRPSNLNSHIFHTGSFGLSHTGRKPLTKIATNSKRRAYRPWSKARGLHYWTSPEQKSHYSCTVSCTMHQDHTQKHEYICDPFNEISIYLKKINSSIKDGSSTVSVLSLLSFTALIFACG